MLGWKPNMIYYLLLGRALDKPPKLLLVIPSKLDCLKLAIFLRLELKTRLELNEFSRRFQEKCTLEGILRLGKVSLNTFRFKSFTFLKLSSSLFYYQQPALELKVLKCLCFDLKQ